MSGYPRPIPLKTTDQYATNENVGFVIAGANGNAVSGLRWTGVDEDAEAAISATNAGADVGLRVRGGADIDELGIGGTLTVGRIIVTVGPSAFTGDVGITGTLNVNGAVDFDSNANVDGALTVNGTAQLNGAVTIDDTLHVTGAVDLDSTLNVDGAATFQAAVTVKGNTTLGDATSDATVVNGTTTLNNTVSIVGQSADSVLLLKYAVSTGQFNIGASNSATPDLIFRNFDGTETFRVGDHNATWQALVTGDLKTTGKAEITNTFTAKAAVVLGGAASTVGFFGQTGATIRTITGALSAVADANAKAVLTSIIAAADQTSLSLWVKATT